QASPRVTPFAQAHDSLALEMAGDAGAELRSSDRLRNEVVHAGTARLLLRALLGIRRDEDDREIPVGREGAELSRELDAGNRPHADVHYEERWRGSGELLVKLVRRVAGHDAYPLALEQELHDRQDGRVVVENEN